MRNEDNDCIRYLMKEMDPSEELLMERAMMEDEDLLIEVESMRQTLAKLDRLPQKNPPSELTDHILEQAAKQAEKNRKSQQAFKPLYRYAAAATIALTLTAGGAWFFMGAENSSGGQTAASEAAQQGSTEEAPVFDIAEIASFTSIPAEEKNVDPWVDRNEVLQFEDRMLNQSREFNALIQSSTRKLQLIDSPAMRNQRTKSLQLTGAGNQ